MSLADRIENNYSNCLVTRCIDQGCRLKLDKISDDHIIISGGKYQEYFDFNQNLCDFFIFDLVHQDHSRVAVVELKSGTIDEGEFEKAFRQLQNGANIVNKLVNGFNINVFVSGIVKGKRINAMAVRMLRKTKYMIQFRDKKVPIRIIRCGDSLVI
ncbi:MAG: hypothetical protein JW712_10280 [Dehalococcoidales bacterium]|nr:hypothetical protein [Dehalococcoidales bacterium]